ncbi:MAG: type III pantothenate kinase [Deltaproteobacteria bacterium]|nr:type III pantothenate kinase [Deltaproteobacteria bacterium]
MLHAVDVGNSNTVIGTFVDGELTEHYRLTTAATRTADEWLLLLKQLGLGDFSGAAEAIIASVVPSATAAIEQAFSRLAMSVIVVGPGVKTGVPILAENPKEVGADRVVNAAAAFDRYPGGLIVVDFGTATTFDCVSPRGEYLGGAIAPGLAISAEALYQRAAKLPRVGVERPRQVIGRNTVDSMKSGLFFGYVGLVDGLVERMKGELDFAVRVVATGGLAARVADVSASIEQVDEHLTLHGLHLIYRRNQP